MMYQLTSHRVIEEPKYGIIKTQPVERHRHGKGRRQGGLRLWAMDTASWRHRQHAPSSNLNKKLDKITPFALDVGENNFGQLIRTTWYRGWGDQKPNRGREGHWFSNIFFVCRTFHVSSVVANQMGRIVERERERDIVERDNESHISYGAFPNTCIVESADDLLSSSCMLISSCYKRQSTRLLFLYILVVQQFNIT